MPYRIACLLYCFNAAGEVLLLHRKREPNAGLWSPPGGKLRVDVGESPYVCACREAKEEMGVDLGPADLRLTGLISEHGYAGQAHWLMFLFEVLRPMEVLPPEFEEGVFGFFSREALEGLALPETDRHHIWPWFWEYRGGFFAAHCHCHEGGTFEWKLEEARRV